MPHLPCGHPVSQCPVVLSQWPPYRQSQRKRQPQPKYPALQPVKVTIHQQDHQQLYKKKFCNGKIKRTLLQKSTSIPLHSWHLWLIKLLNNSNAHYYQLFWLHLQNTGSLLYFQRTTLRCPPFGSISKPSFVPCNFVIMLSFVQCICHHTLDSQVVNVITLTDVTINGHCWLLFKMKLHHSYH